MKRVYIMVAAIAALALCACNKEEIAAPADNGKVTLNVNFDVTAIAPSTKAVKSGWESGDKIYIWFDENVSATPDMTLSYTGSKWDASALDAAVAAGLNANGVMKFVWVGSNDLESWTYSAGAFTPAAGKGFPRILRSPANNEYAYDSATSTLTGTLNWEYLTNLQVVIEGMSLSDDYRLNCGSDAAVYSALSVGAYSITGTSGADILGVANDDGVAFNLYVANPDYTANVTKTFHFSLLASDNTSLEYVVTKNLTFNSTTNARTTFFGAKMKLSDFKAVQKINGHEYVEMGDGLKWATMNVGASSPEGTGDYFAWGETVPQSPATYSWSTYSFGTMGNMSKYNATDELTFLLYADDAARVNWGGTWRTPKRAEWQAFWNDDNFEWEWDDTNKGYTITSKVAGYEGNSIFIPANTGHIENSAKTQTDAGWYWDADLYVSYNSAAYVATFSTPKVPTGGTEPQPTGHYGSAYFRNVGRVVRAVSN